MNNNINLGKIDKNGFKESKSALIARYFIEMNNNIKTHFMEMDRTPNFDGKLMILDGSFERLTVEVQIKTLPRNVRKDEDSKFSFSCDTKAMNCVIKNVTFNPVVLIVVDLDTPSVYYKILTRDFVSGLKIGNKKTKRIWLSEEDRFQANKFIKQIYRQVKITETDVDCLTECGKIRESIRNAEMITKEELLHFQYDKDYIHINRAPSSLLDVTDADIANIIL